MAKFGFEFHLNDVIYVQHIEADSEVQAWQKIHRLQFSDCLGEVMGEAPGWIPRWCMNLFLKYKNRRSGKV